MYSQEEKRNNVVESLSTNKQKVYMIINRAHALSIDSALHDNKRSGKPKSITDPASSYLIRNVCKNLPKFAEVMKCG